MDPPPVIEKSDPDAIIIKLDSIPYYFLTNGFRSKISLKSVDIELNNEIETYLKFIFFHKKT